MSVTVPYISKAVNFSLAGRTERPIKVLYIAPDAETDDTCASRSRVRCLLPALDRQVELKVIAFGVQSRNRLEVQDLRLVPRRGSTPTLLLATATSRPRALWRYCHPEAERSFISTFTQWRPEIVHFDSFGVLGLWRAFSRLEPADRPAVVMQPHDSVTRLTQRLWEAERKAWCKFDLRLQLMKIQQVERRIYPAASLCLVDSVEDATFLRRLNSTIRVRVMPLGYDETRFDTQGTRADLRHPAILFSGAMNSEQSIAAATHLVRDIMPPVWKRLPGTTLYLVGANPDSRITHLAEMSEGRVVVTGFVEDLAAYLRAADVYACPLRLGSGMRTRIVEAAACGCPIVTYPEGVIGIERLPGLPPWRVIDSDRAFSDSLVELLTDPGACQRLAECARESVKARYTWTAIAQRLVREYANLRRQIKNSVDTKTPALKDKFT